MACPFFEPRELVLTPRRGGARLPLIDEYAGLCHASGHAAKPPEEALANTCNQGYAHACPLHPESHAILAMRYTVTQQSEGMLHVMWIEESAHAPARWGTVRFDETSERLLDEVPSPPVGAQLIVFCRSYLALGTPARP